MSHDPLVDRLALYCERANHYATASLYFTTIIFWFIVQHLMRIQYYTDL
jgi:hypothetical protein